MALLLCIGLECIYDVDGFFVRQPNRRSVRAKHSLEIAASVMFWRVSKPMQRILYDWH